MYENANSKNSGVAAGSFGRASQPV